MEGLQKKKGKRPNLLADTVFSWSLDDVHNERLYKNKVEKIPESFQSVEHYFGCYLYPLLEETRAQVQSSMETIYRAPYAQVVYFDRAKPYGKKLYNIRVDYWRNWFNDRGREPYKTLPGDLFASANTRPETVSDLQRLGRSWAFGSVTIVSENETRDDTASLYFKVKASKGLEVVKSTPPQFMVFLVNLIPNGRIWKALHMSKNLNIIEEVMCTKSVTQKNLCSEENTDILNKESLQSSSSGLNESQTGTLLACLEMLHSCIVKMVTAVEFKSLYCSLAEVLLFGNMKRLKVGSDIEDIFLDFCLKRLVECLGPQTVSRHCFTEFTPMIDCLEDGVSRYCTFLETELTIEKEVKTVGQLKAGESRIVTKVGNDKCKFEFIRDRFVFFGSAHRYCLSVFCTHMAEHNISVNNIQNMVLLINLVDSFESLSCQVNAPEAHKDILSHFEVEDVSETCADSSFLLFKNRRECLQVLHELFDSLSGLDLRDFMKQEFLMTLCFQSAFLMIGTASSSYKLHKLAMDPLSIVVIDEAVELTECESTIPLQLPGLKQAVLLIDECQLPAIVKSIDSNEVGLEEVCLGDYAQLVTQNTSYVKQYRHPLRSFFPSSSFCDNIFLAAPNLKRISHEENYLKGSIFGCYSFINVIRGREEKDDDGLNEKNMVDIAIVGQILQNLYKESVWETLVHDTKNSRQCFPNVDGDKELAKAILQVTEQFGQQYGLLSSDSVIFKSSRWEVLFSGNFLKLLKKLMSDRWKRTPKDLRYIQELKIWDILAIEDVPTLVKCLEGFSSSSSHSTETSLNDMIDCDEDEALQDSFHEVPPQYTKGSSHGTTIFWVQLRDRVLVGVDSQKTQEWIGSKSNNYRRYEVMISGEDRKFIEIISGVYCTLCGDTTRCWMMVEYVREVKELFVEYLQLYADCQCVAVQTELTLKDVGEFACHFFLKYPITDPKEKESTVYLCAWMPLLEEYHVIVVGDVYDKPQLMTKKVFRSGSGSVFGLRQLTNLKVPIDENTVMHELIKAAATDPHTGGYLHVWTLFRGMCMPPRSARLIDQLRHPAYANMLLNGKSMFVIIRSIDCDI